MKYMTMIPCLKNVGDSHSKKVSGVMFGSKQEEGGLLPLLWCLWQRLMEFRYVFHGTIQLMGKRIRTFSD